MATNNLRVLIFFPNESETLTPFDDTMKKLEPSFYHMHFKQFLETQVTKELKGLINSEPGMAKKFDKGFCGGINNRFGWYAWAKFSNF